MTTGKNTALTRRAFVDKVMSLLFNMLSRLVINFLPRSTRLLISWLQSPSAVILEPPKIKCDTVSSSISHEVMGPDAMIFCCNYWTFHSDISFNPYWTPSGWYYYCSYMTENYCLCIWITIWLDIIFLGPQFSLSKLLFPLFLVLNVAVSEVHLAFYSYKGLDFCT